MMTLSQASDELSSMGGSLITISPEKAKIHTRREPCELRSFSTGHLYRVLVLVKADIVVFLFRYWSI